MVGFICGTHENVLMFCIKVSGQKLCAELQRLRHCRRKSRILVSDTHLVNSSLSSTMKHISFAVVYIVIFGLSSSNFLDCHLQGITFNKNFHLLFYYYYIYRYKISYNQTINIFICILEINNN